MQGQRKADLIASNVSSIVAICAKGYNSYPSKAVIFPDRRSQQHKLYTGTWACLCQWSLAWPRMFPLFAWSLHIVLSRKIQTGLLDPFRRAGEKLEPSHDVKGSTFLLPLPLERALFHFLSPQSPSGPSIHSTTAIIQHD